MRNVKIYARCPCDHFGGKIVNFGAILAVRTFAIENLYHCMRLLRMSNDMISTLAFRVP